MTGTEAIAAIVGVLELPAGARVDTRVPKKMLVEQGAPTATDKRAIQDGVDEIQWLAVLKPTTTALQAYKDETHDYSEIAVIGAVFRPRARTTRLTELIHRAIPYPVLLLAVGDGSVALSAAPKRAAQNHGDKVVAERIVSVGGINPGAPEPVDRAFLDSLPLRLQPARDLSTVYEGWLARIEALVAARVSGTYHADDESGPIERRRAALKEYARLTHDLSQLRTRAAREKQINRRVDLNLTIHRLETEISTHKKNL
jgi:hypothetical protein